VNLDVVPPPSVAATDPDALIREARRRQRRRRLVVCAAAGVALAGVLGPYLAASGRSQPPAARPPSEQHPQLRPGAGHGAVPPAPAVIPVSVDSTVLMWPVGPEQDGTIYLDNLRTRHLGWARAVVDPGEYQPIMLVKGRIVFVSGSGRASATDAVTGKTRVLGNTPVVAPSAAPGRVWLEYSGSGRRPVVRLVSVAAGQPGSLIRLPGGTELIAGTDTGLLLAARNGYELWNPGSNPATLPHSESAQAFAVSPRLVAYDTGCASEGTSPYLSYGGNYGFSACRFMRVYDVVSGELRSFAAPPGSLGWIPSHGGYWSHSAIAPSGAAMAAKALIAPADQGVTREFVLHLSGRDKRAIAVPSSAAFLLSVTAWSVRSSWLFYQGPGERMWAYQLATGDVRSSRTLCCQYATMATLSGGR
jgi:hypothetical protein